MSLPQPDILYTDANLVALNKPSGLAVLADRSGAPCLWEMLPDLIRGKPYQVHRLDKGTSGVLLVARNPETQRRLTGAFRDRLVRKFYLAWVAGEVQQSGLINLPLRRGRKSRYRVAGRREDIVRTERGWALPSEVAPDPGHAGVPAGLPSLTRLRPLRLEAGRTLVLLMPHTGRTHQLRVHLAWIGKPIMGDHLYGKPDHPTQQASRLQLHCHRLVVPGVRTFHADSAEGWL